jgi:hypothetical protein
MNLLVVCCYLLSNLIWFDVFDLTGDETQLPKMDIHAL